MNDQMPGEPVLILGSGALACLFAARLAAIGTPVVMLGSWAEGLEALRRDGVRLQTDSGRWERYPVQAVSSLPEQASFRQALVLVKSWQTRRAARQLGQWLAEDGVALSLQNGLGNREILLETLGAGRAGSGVTTLGASLLGPGQVRQAGVGPVTLEAAPELAALGDLLRRAGFQVDTSPDLRSLQWGKLVINAAINPLTAVLGVSNGELLARPEARALLRSLADEAAAVARGLDVSLPYSDAPAAAEAVARRTAPNRSSMLQDVRRGAPTEVDAINGVVVHTAESLGLAAPFNLCLWQLVKALVLNTFGGTT